MISKFGISIDDLSNVSAFRITHFLKNTLALKIKNLLNDDFYSISDKNFINLFNHLKNEDFILSFENNFKEKFFLNPSKKDEIVDVFKIEYKHLIPKIINRGDEYCDHIFDFLGSGKTKLDKKIDWHLDFKSGFRWDSNEKFIGTANFLNLNDSSDVKIPWELSRCQHFATLGKAYWLTGDEKYAKEFVDEVENWIDSNPINLGVNWASTMDVAIRAINWLWAYCFFMNSKSLTNEFKLKLIKNIYYHGIFIYRNLEFGLITSNHYLSNIVGLIYIGILFPSSKDSKKWIEFGCKEFVNEMKFQIHPDGVDFEASTSYHRLVTEMFLSTFILCRKNKIYFSKLINKRLEKMIEFILFYTKPNGKCPLIGDADNGRLHILSEDDINDHRYLLNIGAIIFNRVDFKRTYDKFSEEAFWLLGTEGLQKYKKLNTTNQKTPSKKFENGGFFIMRDNNLYSIIKCGDVGLKGRGAHGHCDCLSFELYVKDKEFIIDPGTYVYSASPKWRNLFRSTKYHNTICIDDKEMNRFNDNSLFSMKFDSIPKLNKWNLTDKEIFFDAEHNGYKKLENPVVHRRQISLNKEKEFLIIKDILSGKGKHNFEWFFHFAPMNLRQEKKGGKAVVTICKGANIRLEHLTSSYETQCDISEGWVSRSYGKKEKAPIVRYKLNKDITDNDLIAEFKISLIK